MRNKLVKARPQSNQTPTISVHQDDEHNPSSETVVPAAAIPGSRSPLSETSESLREQPLPRSTLTSASKGAINTAMPGSAADGMNGKAAPAPAASSLSTKVPNRMNSTIRAVPNSEDRRQHSEEDSSTEGTQAHSTSRDSALSSSPNSSASITSSISQHKVQATTNGITKMPSVGRLRPTGPTTTQDGSEGLLDAIPRTLKNRPSFVSFTQRESSLSPAAATASLAPLNTNTEPPPGEGGGGGGSGGSGAGPNPIPNDVSLSATEAHLSNGWDNSVGKAGLGKTGRVINRLVSDNEALKRDIQIERLRAEESRQTARLLEDKLERVISEYESRLLEASVTKTLLARKERQVESLQDAVELERKRAADARERERIWKEEMDRAKAEAKRRVEEATNYAALCEGRYNAISSHWRDQGEEVRRAMSRMRAEVESLAAERKRDDEKIETLRELCDQQDGNIRELKRQKEEIVAQFERYKVAQEEALRDIKRRADEREREQEWTLQETREVLDKLKWALNVKEKIEWAQ
ncbi:hypothetical protein VTK56DRAFT_2818 [Thermocarpiscus australiensis]